MKSLSIINQFYHIINIEMYVRDTLTIVEVVKALNKSFITEFSISKIKTEKESNCIYFKYSYPNRGVANEFWIQKCSWIKNTVEPFLYRKFGRKVRVVSIA